MLRKENYCSACLCRGIKPVDYSSNYRSSLFPFKSLWQLIQLVPSCKNIGSLTSENASTNAETTKKALMKSLIQISALSSTIKKVLL